MFPWASLTIDPMKIVVLFLFALIGCSKGSDSAEHKRSYAFFEPMINPAADFDGAAGQMSRLKVLTSTQKYDMRYALFDNGKFYYEVANLGTGVGDWKFRDGYINLFSPRTFFDIDIDFVATEAEGGAMAMRFLDRFGQNTVSVQLREPTGEPLRKLAVPTVQTF